MVARKQGNVWWHVSNPGQRPRAWWVLPSHRALLLLGILGVAADLLVLRGRARLLLAVAVAPVAYVAVLHIVMPAEPRFNVPVMPLLIASGRAGPRRRPGRQRRSRRETASSINSLTRCTAGCRRPSEIRSASSRGCHRGSCRSCRRS